MGGFKLQKAPPKPPRKRPWKAFFECVNLFSNRELRLAKPMKPEIAVTCRKYQLFKNWVYSHDIYSNRDIMSCHKFMELFMRRKTFFWEPWSLLSWFRSLILCHFLAFLLFFFILLQSYLFLKWQKITQNKEYLFQELTEASIKINKEGGTWIRTKSNLILEIVQIYLYLTYLF